MTEDDYFAHLRAAPPALAVERQFHAAGLTAPGRLAFGCGAAQSAGRHLAALTEQRRVLLISDAVLAGIGMVALLTGWLQAAGFSVVTFAEVEPEPSLQTAERAHALARSEAVDAVVGLGGGSVLDVSKFVALGLGTDLGIDALSLPGGIQPTMRMAPLLLIPTTAGTGSETSIYAVLTAGSTKRALASPVLVPQAAILDPLLTFSMPARVTAMTGLDALTHATEAMMHSNATPMCQALSAGAIRLIGGALRRACTTPDDHAARYDMLAGSAMAMMSFSQSGGLWAHSVSYVLGHHLAVPHGLGCALGLPALLRFNAASCPQVLAEIGHQLGATDAAGAVEQLMRDTGLPTSLAGVGMTQQQLPTCAAEMLDRYPRPFNPRPMSAAEGLHYWQDMFAGAPAR